MDSEPLCWTNIGSNATCMMPADHDGPHEPTPDEDIIIRLADDKETRDS